jgi:hypothetical protein
MRPSGGGVPGCEAHPLVGEHRRRLSCWTSWLATTLPDLPARQEWFFGAGLLAEVGARLGERVHAATLN